MADQVPKAVVQERFDRLIELQERVSWAENRTVEGREVEVLVAPGEGRKDGATARLSGRARDNRLVHFAVPEGAERPRPGDVVTVGVTYGAPHHLVADSGVAGGVYAVRRTAGGDAWAALQDAAVPGKPAVSLGMPSIGRPAAGGRPQPPPARPESDQEERGGHAEARRTVATSPVSRGGGPLVRRLLVPTGERAAAYSGVGSNGSRLSGGSPERACDTGPSLSAGARECLEPMSPRCPGQPNGTTLAERPRPPTDRSGAPVASSEDQGRPMAPSAFTCAWSTCSAYVPPVALSTASPPRSMAWSLSCSTWSGWSPASS